MTAMMYIGAQKEAIAEARKAIMEILKAGRDEATTREALQALTKVCSVGTTHIENCVFTSGETVKRRRGAKGLRPQRGGS